MKRKKLSIFITIIVAIAIFAAGCSGADKTGGSSKAGLADAAGEYYLDLTSLGMKLTIFLRLSDDGSFVFSNTPEFQVDKSSGTWQKSEDLYLMVFTSVNGEDKSISDGLSSSFRLLDDKSLDFTTCERIYYGSASATTTSADYPDAKLMGIPIPDGYQAPSNETEFTKGSYTAQADGAEYRISFYDDNSYLLTVKRQGQIKSENGKYSVSTTQLALEPEGGNRLSNDVIDSETLNISAPVVNGDREQMEFIISDEERPQEEAIFTGKVQSADGGSITCQLTLFSDGSFEAAAGDFKEQGVIAINTDAGTYKIYPDHPETGVRGLMQVATVPVSDMSIDAGGKMTLSDFRIRTSESLNRSKCTFTEN